MRDEIVYMLLVVAVGFGVNYALRALPFLLFAGRSRALPSWVERLGRVLAPVIIACLVLYSYSGLAWKTAWPYLAGALTIALQLWRRNALISIVAGTVLYMVLLTCGCASRPPVSFDADNPAVRISQHGTHFAGQIVPPETIPERLDDLDVPKDRTIHIRLDPEVRNLQYARLLMALLAREGYKNVILVTERHAESRALGRKRATNTKKEKHATKQKHTSSASYR